MWLEGFGTANANALAGNDGWSCPLPREFGMMQNDPPLFAMAESVGRYILPTSNFCFPIVNGDVVAAVAERVHFLQDRISPGPNSVKESLLLM